MKIIKEGKLPEKDTIYTGTCQNCGCEIECESHERRGTWPISVVHCPTDSCEGIAFVLPKAEDKNES